MKQRNGIINHIMRVPKKLYVAAALLLFAGGAGTVLALQPEEKPKQAIVQQVASVEPQEQEQTTPAETTPAVEQTQTNTPAPQEESPPSVTNPFQQGFSAWHVFNRRAELGKSTPTSNSTQRFCTSFANDPNFSHPAAPELHAIACKNGSGGSGDHAMVIEQINADGSVWVSEMNSRGQVSITDDTPAGGFNRVDYKLLPPDHLTTLQFIQ